ncbi:MAG: hypothetical protein EOP10_01500 [Proteobacteria bacterium]|nr:MAG: hypothetical protein EOP10_01500 [Pseudomonadota bacterium]
MRTPLILLALSISSLGIAKAPFNYAFDDAPLKKHATEAAELEKLRAEGQEKPATRESLKRQFDLLGVISQAEPEWVDGYWMLGEAAFQYGNSLTNPKDRDFARNIFVQGQKATETCLKKAPDNAPCKMFLGAAMGKIASIDGIFSSLKKAHTIEKLWLDVIESGKNYPFSKSNTIQGSARYALGIFYRLVPDSMFLNWMFDAKGDINKSIKMHKESVEEDGPNACNLMMLGVSQLCSVKGDVKSKVGLEGLNNFAEAKKLPVKNALAMTCANDIPEIEKDPTLACGYETSRQQEEKSEEEIKKLKGKN